jgi:hypothetical protein
MIYKKRETKMDMPKRQLQNKDIYLDPELRQMIKIRRLGANITLLSMNVIIGDENNSLQR